MERRLAGVGPGGTRFTQSDPLASQQASVDLMATGEDVRVRNRSSLAVTSGSPSSASSPAAGVGGGQYRCLGAWSPGGRGS